MDIKTKNPRVQNYLKAATFRNPEWIPCALGILPAAWKQYGEKLEKILLNHPKLFPDYKKQTGEFGRVEGPGYTKGRFKDLWGCVWENIAEGLESMVVESPLSDWDALEHYHAPDLDHFERGDKIDWNSTRTECEKAKVEGKLAGTGVAHGFMYMRLFYLRGFENFMMDVALEEPKLDRLIEIVLNYNLEFVKKLIDAGTEAIYFGDDLGLQKSLPISPEKWRRYIKPCYRKIFGLCRDAGVLAYLHTDGHILEIIPDLIECGVNILNPQFRANTLDGLVRVARGRICLNQDLDRQMMPFASPAELEKHIRDIVDRLNLPEGGLMLLAEIGPDVPLENVEAIADALEEVGGPA